MCASGADRTKSKQMATQGLTAAPRLATVGLLTNRWRLRMRSGSRKNSFEFWHWVVSGSGPRRLDESGSPPQDQQNKVELAAGPKSSLRSGFRLPDDSPDGSEACAGRKLRAM